MSKLEELIKVYCPDGVEYKKIKDVYSRLKGTPITAGKMKEIANDNGNIKIIAGGKTVVMANEEDIPKANIIRVPAVLVQSRGVIDFIFYEEPFTFKNEMWAYTTDERISVKYLYYVLKNNVNYFREAASGMGSLPQISLPVTEEFRLPVPPLEVQREIVRVLDNFTFFSAELSAELQARKKQYEYYRDKMLSFESDSKEMTILDMLSQPITDGPHETPQLVSDGVPFLSAEAIVNSRLDFSHARGYISKEYDNVCAKKYKPQKNDVFMCKSGSTTGKVAINDTDADFNIWSPLAAMRVNENNNPKYLFYLLQSKSVQEQVRIYASHGSQPNLSMRKLEQFKVRVPSLKVQNRIVEVLDNFEAICSDLNIGIPAEIEARQKQYEYYRDALLTFAESGTIISRQTDRQSIIRLIQYVFGYAHITLGDVGKVSMCKRILKDETSTDGEVPFFKIGTFGGTPDAFISQTKYDEYTSKYSFPQKGDILISAAGTIGRTVRYNGEKAYFQDSNIVWIANDESIVLNDYLYYLYQLQPWKVSTGGTIARLYNDNISSAKVDVPSIPEQKRIVDVLRHFDDLCNNLSVGLPAEIEARQKQYEYYRDKLLSFKEK